MQRLHDGMDAGARITQGAVVDDCTDAGGRTTQGAVVEEQISAHAVVFFKEGSG
jgi:hypothetical protein